MKPNTLESSRINEGDEPVLNRMNSRKLLAFVSVLLALMVLVATVKIVATVVDIVQTSTLPFDRDEAQHAIDGWQVYHAAVSHDLGGVVTAVRDQGYYPPLHSLLVAAGYWIGEPGLVYSRLPSVAELVVILLLLVWATKKLLTVSAVESERHWEIRLVASLLVVLLAVSSHALVITSALCMQELTGAVFALVLIIYIAAVERNGKPHKGLVYLGLAFFTWLLFLVKYSFGLYFSLGLIAAMLTGDLRLSHLSFKRLIPPLIFGSLFAVLVLLWMASTDRQSLIKFFTLHQGIVSVSLSERLLYYPRAWLYQFSITPLIGCLSIGLFLIGLTTHWQKLAVRTAFWSTLAAFMLVASLPNNDTRHVIVVVPLIWLLAGLGFTRLVSWLQRRPFGNVYALTVLGVLLLVVFANMWPFYTRLGQDISNLYETKLYHRQMQDQILETVDLEQPVLLLGDWKDTNSLLNLRWLAALETEQSLWQLTIDQYPFSSREWVLAMTNRKLQLTDDKPFNGSEPLSAVVQTGYYHYVVEAFYPKEGAVIDPDELFAGTAYRLVASGDFEGHKLRIFQIAGQP